MEIIAESLAESRKKGKRTAAEQDRSLETDAVRKRNHRLYGDGMEDDNDDDNTVVIEKNKIKINGSTIQYNSSDKDSVIINGTKMPKAEADKIIDSMKTNIGKMENVDISIKDGKKEISIKTK